MSLLDETLSNLWNVQNKTNKCFIKNMYIWLKAFTMIFQLLKQGTFSICHWFLREIEPSDRKTSRGIEKQMSHKLERDGEWGWGDRCSATSRTMERRLYRYYCHFNCQAVAVFKKRRPTRHKEENYPPSYQKTFMWVSMPGSVSVNKKPMQWLQSANLAFK